MDDAMLLRCSAKTLRALSSFQMAKVTDLGDGDLLRPLEQIVDCLVPLRM